MKREDLLSKISDPSKVWDVVVIGGGATGLGVAVDAVTRGYSVALFEWEDFAKQLPVVVPSWCMEESVFGSGRCFIGIGGFVRKRLLQQNAPHLVKINLF